MKVYIKEKLDSVYFILLSYLKGFYSILLLTSNTFMTAPLVSYCAHSRARIDRRRGL